MPAPALHRATRRPRRPQLESHTPLIALAVARQVVEEASLFLRTPLPARYAAGLAFRAKLAFARSPSFRHGFRQRADAGRDRLYAYMRHWLAARLHAERPRLYALLPAGYCVGEPLPPTPPLEPVVLSPSARLLAGFY
ncbi:MAG: hypothetical protein V4773_22935 [Verrucomicrobiota bacterium]